MMRSMLTRLMLLACFGTLVFGCNRVTPVIPDAPRDESRDLPTDEPQGQPKEVPVLNRPTKEVSPRVNAPSSGRLLALLVGCTKYDNLPEQRWLKGPANDVELMRQTLLNWKKKFKTTEIVTLSEKDGARNTRLRPTRENIKREFAELAKNAESGDQVVILLAGHGSQQPDQPPYDETDGLDEIFLPADTGKWDDKKKTVTNAIIDDELEVWLKKITTKKASVWITIDACHSGTMSRDAKWNPDSEAEVERELVPQELGISEKELEEAKRRAPKQEMQRGGSEGKPTAFEIPTGDNLVAIYASRSIEPTLETLLPLEGSDRKYYGLLTFTLCEVLRRATTDLTYTEVVQQIQAKYDAWGRVSPKPLVEGPDRDRAVLGSQGWSGRSALLLGRNPEDESLQLRAGALLGLTKDTILAVYPLAGSPDPDKLLGHVRITQLNYLDSKVVPHEFAGVPAPMNLKPEGRCEVVALDYGKGRLKLAVAPRTDADDKATEAARNRLGMELKALNRARPGLIEVVDNPAQADWLVRLEKDKVYLVSTKLSPKKPGEPLSRFLEPAGDDKQLRNTLEKLCGTIAKVQTLLALVESSEGEKTREAPAVDVNVEMIRYGGPADKIGTVMPWRNGGRTLKAGDEIAFRMTNHSRFAVYVTLLFVDPDYGISPYFPERGGGVEDNCLLARATWTTPRGKVSGDPPGRDRLVVIAVKDEGQPVDFCGLAQQTLGKARGVSKKGLDSPLGQFLEGAFFKDALRGTFKRARISSHSTQLLSWETVP